MLPFQLLSPTQDEEATLRALTACCQVTDSLILQHRGRVVGSAGDIVFLDDSWINRRGTARRAPTTPDLGVLPISDTFPWSPQIKKETYSVLAEFASVVEAVQCAVEIQTALKSENANL